MNEIEIINELYDSLGEKIPRNVEAILDLDIEKVGREPSQDFMDAFKELHEKIFAGLIVSMIKGKTLGQKSLIKDRFGTTIEEKWNNSSKEFIDFANCYWTYKLNLEELAEKKNNNLVSLQLLGGREVDIASIFFPTPGPQDPGAKKRERAQRDILEEAIKEYDLNGFDLESYIAGNPYLVKKRRFGIF